MRYLPLLLALAFSAAAEIPEEAFAQQQNTTVEVNFIYAFELGFGSYDVGGLDVQVYGIPISHKFKNLFGNEKLSLLLDSPVYYGRFRFRHTFEDGSKIKVNQDVLSYIPGVQLEYEVVDNWYLKPFVYTGLAWVIYDKAQPSDINLDEAALFLYSLGVTSLYELFWRQFTFSVGNRVSWAGNTEFNGEGKQSYGLLENGFDIKHPLGFCYKGYEPDVGVFFNWYYFFPAAEFDKFLRPPLKVENQYEIAMSVGFAKPKDIWILGDPRIGVGYRFGDLKAFAVNFGFPF